MTKLITSLDQLEPGMFLEIGMNFAYSKYTVKRRGIKGTQPWIIAIQNQENGEPVNYRFSDNRVEAIFLNKKVEVPE